MPSGNGGMWGYVWQGRAYEGLTCNALEWVASAGGGTVVDRDGQVTVNNPRAVAAVDQAAEQEVAKEVVGIENFDLFYSSRLDLQQPADIENRNVVQQDQGVKTD